METGVQIERKTGAGGTYALIHTTAANATTFQDTGRSALTQYYYRVRSTNAAGNSAFSNEANATTHGAIVAPSNVAATATSTSQATVTWTDNSGTETGFEIERKTGPTGTYSVVGTAGANATSFPDSGLTSLTRYYYRVRAMSAAGNSLYSNEGSVIPPADTFTNVYYIQTDHLNTPRAVSNASNTIVWRWDSDPFGSTAADQDPDANSVTFEQNLRFPGQYFDKETNLHYNYFRDYDPAIGRYVQSDPIGLAGGINTYAYVRSNPLGFTDPSGLTIEDMNYILSQVRSQFPEVNPRGNIELMGPVLNSIYGSGVEGVTNPITGTMYLPSKYGAQKCLSRAEWETAFFQSVFHESMHSTDPWYKTFIPGHHESIYNRVAYEQLAAPPGPKWGKPRASRVNKDALYQQYKNNSPDCICSK